MPSRIFIVHGAYGNPSENWIPWLCEELRAKGHIAVAPQFPTPQEQSLESWKRAFWRDTGKVGSDTILVGHSIGCAFILNTAMIFFQPIKAAFLISPFISPLGNPEFDEINSTFFSMGFDWDAIRKSIGKATIYHSDNDPYVPKNLAEDVAKNLGTQINVIPGAGHFNEAAGFSKFERLLSDILKIA